jgi:hypothetical protein
MKVVRGSRRRTNYLFRTGISANDETGFFQGCILSFDFGFQLRNLLVNRIESIRSDCCCKRKRCRARTRPWLPPAAL